MNPIRLYHGTTSKRASKIVGGPHNKFQGFQVGENGAVYFAEDIATARFFGEAQAIEAEVTAARIQNPIEKPVFYTVIEFTIPLPLAEELKLSPQFRAHLGEYSGLSFPDILDGSGHELIIHNADLIAKFNAAISSNAISVRRLKYTRRSAV